MAAVSRSKGVRMNRLNRSIISLTLLTIISFSIDVTESFCENSVKSNIAKVVHVDSSIILVHDWTFLYKYAAEEKKPPEGYTWAINSLKVSRELHLRKIIDKSSLIIKPEEIDRIVMRWEEDPRIKGWKSRVEYYLVKKTGEKVDMEDYELAPSFLTDKKFIGLRSLYLSGNRMTGGKSVGYELNFGYSNWSLFKNNRSTIPSMIIFP